MNITSFGNLLTNDYHSKEKGHKNQKIHHEYHSTYYFKDCKKIRHLQLKNSLRILLQGMLFICRAGNIIQNYFSFIYNIQVNIFYEIL